MKYSQIKVKGLTNESHSRDEMLTILGSSVSVTIIALNPKYLKLKQENFNSYTNSQPSVILYNKNVYYQTLRQRK